MAVLLKYAIYFTPDEASKGTMSLGLYVWANASIKPYLQVKLVAISVYYDKISLVWSLITGGTLEWLH